MACNWQRPLGCLPWKGREKDLPRGMTTVIPNFAPRHLASLFGVLDPAEDDGVREVARDQLKPGDIIVAAQINEAAIQAIERAYGPNWILIGDPADATQMTRGQWIKAKGTDPLELLAIADMRAAVVR